MVVVVVVVGVGVGVGAGVGVAAVTGTSGSSLGTLVGHSASDVASIIVSVVQFDASVCAKTSISRQARDSMPFH